MNRLKILFTTILVLCAFSTNAYASNIDSIIQKSDISNNAQISISVKDTKNGKVIYQKDSHKYMHPASTLKVFTMNTAYDKLGRDYTFKTTTYIDKNSNLYIKLGADPSLSTNTLKELLTLTKEKYDKPIKDIVIDKTIFDKEQWGVGWMWDDDTNYLLPKYGALSINENKITITLEPGKNGRLPEISNDSQYKINFVNYLKNGDTNNIQLSRRPWVESDSTYLTGTIKSKTKVKVTVDDIERHFVDILNKSLSQTKIKYTGTVKFAPIPAGLEKTAEINSFILSELIANTLKNSNNFYSEMIFKAMASEQTRTAGTTKDAIDVFNKKYSTIKSDKPIIVDACGISRNNMITADWMTEALNTIYKDKNYNEFVTLLPKPIEGTLADRLLDISLKVRAKTGTASGVSSITGYIDTKSGKKYSFAILIQNFSQQIIDVKRFEDELIRAIYQM